MTNNVKDLHEIKQKIHAAIEKVHDKIPPKVAPMIEEAILKMETEGLTAKEALGLSEDFIEELYELGYHYFQSGKYKEALPIFNVLVQLDGNPRYTFAIAACHHHLKNYIEASGYYLLYEVLDSTNPLPYYHMYDCFRKLNQPELAINALSSAERLAAKDPKYAELKGKVEIELNHLKSIESGSQENNQVELKKEN